jgi:hypothetical protein
MTSRFSLVEAGETGPFPARVGANGRPMPAPASSISSLIKRSLSGFDRMRAGFLPAVVRGWQSVVVALLLLAGLVFFAQTVNEHYPIEHWLFPRYALYWICCFVWLAGSVGTGYLTLTRVFRASFPVHEATLAALVIGLLEYETVMLLAGAVQRFDTATFFAVPFLFLLVGSRSLLALARRFIGLGRRSRPLGAFGFAAVAFGLAGLGMVYFVILTPENVQFDSRWKHLSLAEDWVAWGGLRRRDEGWVFSARPHYTSLLYTWAFLLPGARLFDKMLLCAHLEFVIFAVTTLVGIPALVRRLVPAADLRVVWAARFLFPGVFLYDSSLSGGADHIGATFGVVAGLCLFRAWKRLDLKVVALLAVALAGGVLVKETVALMLVPFPALAIVLRALYLLVQGFRKRVDASVFKNAWLSPLVAVGIGLLVTSPMWLKNLVWYGDPLYPSLHAVFGSSPWSNEASYRLKWAYQEAQMWAPSRDLDGLLETLRALFTYSFDPNDWKRFHRDVPVFGSLFTLLLVCLPFLRSGARIWALVAWVHVAIFAWYSVHHQDRYLQCVLPLMSASTAAIMALVFRQFGVLARGALSLLVAFQIVWGGDVYFLQTHAMARSPIKKVVDLLSAGFDGKYEERFRVQGSYQAIGKLVPRDARLLLHETNINLGTGVTTVLDNPGWQYAIEYGAAKTPAGVHRMLKDVNVTHVFAKTDRTRGTDSLAGEILFYDFLRRYSKKQRSVAGGILAELGDEPPEGPFESRVLLLGCGRDYRSGWYELEDLATPPFGPRAKRLPKPREELDGDQQTEAMTDAEYVVVDPSCGSEHLAALRRGHSLLVKHKRSKHIAEYEIWVRGKLDRTAPQRSRATPASDSPDDSESGDPSEDAAQ